MRSGETWRLTTSAFLLLLRHLLKTAHSSTTVRWTICLTFFLDSPLTTQFLDIMLATLVLALALGKTCLAHGDHGDHGQKPIVDENASWMTKHMAGE